MKTVLESAQYILLTIQTLASLQRQKLKRAELPGKEEVGTHSAHNPANQVMEAPPVSVALLKLFSKALNMEVFRFADRRPA